MSNPVTPFTLAAQQAYGAAAKAPAGSPAARAREAAQGFESVFVQTMMENMMQGLGEDGPLGSGNAGGGAWRGFLVEEYAKGVSKAGGFGIAPQVYAEMMKVQEGLAAASPAARPRS